MPVPDQSDADGGTALQHTVVEAARRAALTVAVAESLTAGMVCARLTDVPGASVVLRGGVVTYATDLKATLLGVDPELLEAHGPVHPDVAAQMAAGVAERLGADVGVATTGVAGPGPADGHPAGTVYIAVLRSGDCTTRRLTLTGDRAAVREGTVVAVIELLLDRLTGTIPGPDALASV